MAYSPLTYRRDEDGTLRYRDAWTTDEGIVQHTGVVGRTGSRKERRASAAASARQLLDAFAAESAELGYTPLPEDHGWVVLQYWAFTPDLSHPEDARIREDTWDALTDYLGNRGVGECDGFDVGGTPNHPDYARGIVMNFFCPVVDATAGVAALRGFIRAFRMGSSAIIGTRPTAEDDYTLAYSPRKSDTTFRL